jgi:FtsP/CotA-like multicopper oxidase with cupredoxin domain
MVAFFEPVQNQSVDARGESWEDDVHGHRAVRLTAALGALVAAATLAAALAACSGGGGGGPQGGVAPRGASAVDAAVTNGATTFQFRDIVALMADAPSDEERFAAASLAAQKDAGKKAAPPRPDPGAAPDYFGTANWAQSPRIRKFVDELPGVGPGGANGLGQYIPVAVPDTVTYPGSDYYELAVREYSERLHSDLPATRLRGYVQLNLGTDSAGDNTVQPAAIQYFGPLIRARRDRPVRIKFVNQLPAGSAGDLFLPVDTTVTGAGTGPRGGDDVYPTGRASLHLHGGLTPWISGGSQYQWVSPAGEASPYRSGPSLVNVPDMWFDSGGRPVGEGTPGATNDPGPGATTLYLPNAQSARFLYLHDDTYGLTRLGVYAGEAAPYVIGDDVEDELVQGNTAKASTDRAIDAPVRAGTVPEAELSLVIEDKTFVPSLDALRATDPTWDVARWGGPGSLWYPHVYMPNQNGVREQGRLSDQSIISAKGRWDYLPWYWTGYRGTVNGPVPNPLYGTVPSQPKENPGTPNLSTVPDAFHDTMLVNGTAYPYVKVGRRAYRLRILNACSDRQLNLQLYYARSNEAAETAPDGSPELQTDSGEVAMLPAQPSMSGGWPARWPTDTRVGGVPDPAAAGPAMIQFGNDGGVLPQTVTHEPTPVGLEVRNPTDQESSMGEYRSVIAITTKALYLAPGERADVIVDFSAVPAGSRLLLYNDAPAPAPNGDSRVDYYTGDRDQTVIGGAPATQAGYGPNTRTIMQFQVNGPAGPAFDVRRLEEVLPAAYAASQDPVLVPTTGYARAYGAALDQTDAAGDGAVPEVPAEERGTLTFTPLGRGYRLTLPVQGKMVSDLFDPLYGRKTAALGVDAPLSANGVRSAVPYSAIDPATEFLSLAAKVAAPEIGDSTQVWRITHDGTVSHAVTFEGFDVQVLERARRDGKARAPDPGELGWKDTVRVDPLESVMIAARPVTPAAPFALPASERPLDITIPLGEAGTFTQLDSLTAEPLLPTIVNATADFSFEARWGIHLMGGEESHAARPVVLQGTTTAPTGLTATATGSGVTLTWQAPLFPPPVTGYEIQRATDGAFTQDLRTVGPPGTGTTYTDTAATAGTLYHYRVRSTTAAGWSPWSATAEVTE